MENYRTENGTVGWSAGLMFIASMLGFGAVAVTLLERCFADEHYYSGTYSDSFTARIMNSDSKIKSF
jgi:hypothetical protein